MWGANYQYVQPLVSELCQQIQQINQPNLAEYLVAQHNIRQGNGHDCGVAVINIIRRIREKYSKKMENIELGEFDFPKERKDLLIGG